jgi:hypothetical protein
MPLVVTRLVRDYNLDRANVMWNINILTTGLFGTGLTLPWVLCKEAIIFIIVGTGILIKSC